MAINKVVGTSSYEETRYTGMGDASDRRRKYVEEITRTPLLTREEEISLAAAVKTGQEARTRLASGALSQKEMHAEQVLIEEGNAARERLLMANTRLVISVAKRYNGRGIPFTDLVQEGFVGLMRATAKYDTSHGTRFSTYATWWIRQAITRSIDNYGRTIRLPVHKGVEINKLYRTSNQLLQELGREPTEDEIADELDVSRDHIQNILQLALPPLSLESPQGDDEDRVLGDMLADNDLIMPEDAAEQNVLKRRVREALHQLSPREAQVLRLRYGFNNGRVHTLREVGRKLGITRERVRQIETHALARLRMGTPSIA